jgi:hypothetical protein
VQAKANVGTLDGWAARTIGGNVSMPASKAVNTFMVNRLSLTIGDSPATGTSLAVPLAGKVGVRKACRRLTRERAMRNLLIYTILLAVATAATASGEEAPSKWDATAEPGLYTGSLDASQWKSAEAGGAVDLQSQNYSIEGQSDYSTYSSERNNEYEASLAWIPPHYDDELVIVPPNGTIPEPGTMTLFGLGLAGAAAAYRKRRARQS